MSKLTSGSLASLINGISQQSPTLRHPSQAAEQVNALSSPVDGLMKRPGTTHVKTLGSFEKPKVHVVKRDEDDTYVAVIENGDLKVFDIDGTERTVSFPNGKDYLQASDSRDALRILTVEDTTFIVNRTVAPVMKPMAYTSNDVIKAQVEFTNMSSEWVFGLLVAKQQSFPYQWPYNATSNLDFGDKPAMLKLFTSVQEMQKWVAQTYVPSLFPGFGVTVPTYTPSEESYDYWSAVHHKNLSTGELYGNADYALSYTTGLGGTLASLGLTEPAPGYLKMQLTTRKVLENSHWYPGTSWTSEDYVSESVARVVGTGVYAELVIRLESVFAFRPNDDTTKYTGVGATGDITNLKYAGYPNDEGLRKVSSANSPFGLYVNGQFFPEPLNVADADRPGHFATAIGAAFPGLVCTVAAGKLVITTSPGTPLSIRTANPAYAKVAYDFSANVRDRLFIYIKQGVADQTYKVSINGNLATYTTGDTEHASTWKADNVAGQLASQINGWSGYTAEVFGQLVMVTPPNGELKFDYHDTWNGQAMAVMKNRVASETELPNRFVEGVVVKIGTEDSGWFVHYTVSNDQKGKTSGSLANQVSNNPFSPVYGNQTPVAHGGWLALEGQQQGVWEETAWPYEERVLDPMTMPHALVSEADGTFTFKPLAWGYREVGDSQTCAAPSFVGKAIQDVFFYRNRLGFITDESVVFSRAGEYFSFFPKTAKDVVDADPIDSLVSHTKVSILRSAVVFNNTVMLFSDSTQFAVTALDTFTPRTINIKPVTEFEHTQAVRPINAGNNVFFVNERQDYSQVFEYIALSQAANDALEVTAHVPTYVPAGLFKLSAGEDMVVAPLGDTLYVYKYLWGGADKGKVQDAWSHWTFGGELLDASFIESDLYLLVKYDNGCSLEVMDLQRGNVEAPLAFAVALDRKFKGKVASGHLTLPYTPAEGLQAINATTGQATAIVGVSGTQVDLGSLPDGTEVTVGYLYEFRYVLSPQYLRDDKGSPKIAAQFKLRTVSFSHSETGAYQVKVTPAYRSTQVKTKGLPIDSGLFRTQVLSDAVTTRIEVSSYNHFPVKLQTMQWEGVFTTRA